jgi:hypothetical protein
LPHSTLKKSLRALTESLVDSVMDAIRGASLEELLGEHRASTIEESPANVERTTSRRRARARHRVKVSLVSERTEGLPTRALRPVNTDSQATASVARTEDLTPPEAAAEITDPQMVLGLEVPRPQLVEDPQPLPEAEAPKSGHHVRLRENETVARVSNAGIVIRRGHR